MIKSAEVWGACVRYLANSVTDKRISREPQRPRFLLVNFARTSHFYEVALDVRAM